MKQKNRSCRHTHYECVDNSGYLVSRIRIRCSVVASITDKQAGNCCSFPAAHQPGIRGFPRVTICRLQRYLLWCMLTAQTVPHFAHLILKTQRSSLFSMSNIRWPQHGHFTGTTPSFTFVSPTYTSPSSYTVFTDQLVSSRLFYANGGVKYKSIIVLTSSLIWTWVADISTTSNNRLTARCKVSPVFAVHKRGFTFFSFTIYIS